MFRSTANYQGVLEDDSSRLPDIYQYNSPSIITQIFYSNSKHTQRMNSPKLAQPDLNITSNSIENTDNKANEMDSAKLKRAQIEMKYK